MITICPTLTAETITEYRRQMTMLEAIAGRIHIDMMDGRFTPTQSPTLDQISWPKHLVSDIHLMYQQPELYIDEIKALKPNLVVFHYEAEVNHLNFIKALKANGIKAGLAILAPTKVEQVSFLLPELDHILIFGGHLGYQGGEADLSLTAKVRQLKQTGLSFEVAWDGGINDQNARQLIEAGVDVLNVGSFIHKADNPHDAYAKLEALIVD